MVQTNEYGALVASPNFTASAKNSTFTIEPSESVALAETERFPGKMNTFPGNGEVSEITGGRLEKFAEPGEMPPANQFVGSLA